MSSSERAAMILRARAAAAEIAQLLDLLEEVDLEHTIQDHRVEPEPLPAPVHALLRARLDPDASPR